MCMIQVNAQALSALKLWQPICSARLCKCTCSFGKSCSMGCILICQCAHVCPKAYDGANLFCRLQCTHLLVCVLLTACLDCSEFPPCVPAVGAFFLERGKIVSGVLLVLFHKESDDNQPFLYSTFSATIPKILTSITTKLTHPASGCLARGDTQK